MRYQDNYTLSDEMDFFILLLTYYAAYKNKTVSNVLNEWENNNITQEIYNNYWNYHTERIENAYEDIDSLIKTGKHAW